jgi:hypothetical protein
MFTYYDAENVPGKSLPLMEQSKKGFGMLPNLHRIFGA